MKKDRIRDIPSISKPLRQMKDILALRDAMPYIRPLLLSQGVDINEIESQLAEVDRLYKEAVEIVSMFDRFNDLFAQRGWISYESMDANVARTAIIKAEEGDNDGAEEILVSYYNAETVEIHLRRMIAVQAFRPRVRLAEKALIDYREERYHACIPIVIMLLDGMVNEVNQRRGLKKGFHAQDVNLEAWDSIAGHSTGLAKLRDVICASRETTKTEIITVPYRHGIMHGMDLGYDTKLVAAKAWAALFAVRE
jgi:hypothetical protein